MANEAKKRSNYLGQKRTDMESYIKDLDNDIRNLFEEKTININYTKRYNLLISSTYGS